MRVATALRIVSVVIVAKALLIGVVYWRRAKMLGRPVHIGTASWASLLAVVTIGVALAATVYVASRHHSSDRTPLQPLVGRSSSWVAARFLSTQPLGALRLSGILRMTRLPASGVWLLSASWCWRRRDVRADMLCDPTGRCCGPSLAHVVDTPLGGAIAVKSSTGLCFPSTAGC